MLYLHFDTDTAPLDHDSTLQDYRLHRFAADLIAKATLVSDNATLSIVKNRASGQSDSWADASQPGEPDQTLANLMR